LGGKHRKKRERSLRESDTYKKFGNCCRFQKVTKKLAVFDVNLSVVVQNIGRLQLKKPLRTSENF
jgi:hypothetical protein